MSSYSTSRLLHSTPAVALPEACNALVESLKVSGGSTDVLKEGLQGLLAASNLPAGRAMIAFNQLIKAFFLSTDLSATDAIRRMNETKELRQKALDALNVARSTGNAKDAVLIHGVVDDTKDIEVSPDK